MRARGRRAGWRIGVVAVAVGAGALWVARDEPHAGLDPAQSSSVEVDVETFSPSVQLGYEPLLVGDVLVSRVNRGDVNDPDHDLVTSTDLGETWTTVALPGQPEPTDEIWIHDLDGAVVVTAELPWPREERNEHVLVWVSTDAVTWNGGAVDVPDPTDKPARLNGVLVTDDGAIVANVYSSDGPADRAIRTVAGGLSWDETDCARGCDGLPRRAGRLSVRYDGYVSLDGGETWRFPDLPGIGEDDLTELDVVEVPGQGWFAVATVSESDGSDGWDERFLLRSADGLQWELVIEADSRCWTGFPGEWISTPVPYGDQFLVAYTCDNPEDPLPGPRLSQLYLLDPAGTTLTAVADTREDNHSYGQPLVVGADILVPRLEFTHGDISFVRLPRAII